MLFFPIQLRNAAHGGRMRLMNFKTLLFICTSMLLVSCGTKESISPAFQPKESTQQTYRFQYVRSDSIDSPTNEFSTVGPIGSIVQNLADALADLMLNEDALTIPLDPIVFYLPEMDNIDLKVIEGVELSRVLVRMLNESENASLAFVKDIEIYLDYGHLLPTTSVINSIDETTQDDFIPVRSEIILGGEIPESAKMVLRYERGVSAILCQDKCLDLRVIPIDFEDIVHKRYTSYTIHLRLVIDGMPKESIKIETLFDIQVKADLFK